MIRQIDKDTFAIQGRYYAQKDSSDCIECSFSTETRYCTLAGGPHLCFSFQKPDLSKVFVELPVKVVFKESIPPEPSPEPAVDHFLPDYDLYVNGRIPKSIK